MKSKCLFLLLFILFAGLMFPQEHKKLYQRGIQMGIKGEFQQARYYFEQSLQENSFYIKARRALDILNDLDGTMITPDAAILLFKAVPFQNRFKWSEALPILREVLVLAPEYYYAHHNLGNVLDGLGKVKDAIKSYNTALSYNSQYPYTYNNLGLSYSRLEMYDRAIDSYLSAIRLFPEYYKACYNLSVAYSKIGDAEKSYKYNKKALEINPDYSLGFQSFMWDWEKFMQQNRRRIQELEMKDPLELLDMLKVIRTTDRILVATVLLKKNSPQLLGALEYLMEDKSALVRSYAVRLMLDAGNQSHVPLMIEMLDDPDWTVRMEVTRTLAILGKKLAVEPLLKALNDRDYHVVDHAAFWLGYIGDPSAVPSLVKVLGHQHYRVRKNAAESLGRIGDRRAVKPLVRMLSDSHSEVRKIVLEALKKLTAQDFGENRSRWQRWLASQGLE